MRNVWNLRPAHIADQITKIELIHAKSSDFAAYEPRAVDFDPRTFHLRPRSRLRVFVGTPAVIAKILAESPPETFRWR